MNHRSVTVATLLTALSTVAGPVARAAVFPISGGSYTANVAVRVNEQGTTLGSMAGARVGATVQGGTVANIIDYGLQAWQLTSLNSGADSATMTLTLDQAYELNKVRTFYSDGMTPANYQLRLYDGAVWTTIVSPSPVTGVIHTDTFTTQTATKIEWTIYGPGMLFGGSGNYAYPKELQAFVSSTAANPPELSQGYNVITAGSIIQTIGTSLASAMDNNVRDSSYAVPGAGGTNVVDLGEVVYLDHFKFSFYSGQQWDNLTVDLSRDLSTWTTIVNSNNITTSQFTFGPTAARYIRLGGRGGGALVEFSAFGTVPEPSALMLLALGAALWWRSRGRR